MSFIIGTAGHIDHGKTSLVKALTGQDTDRLKEEKERGISIDLGFAHLDLPDGTRAGVVDVPGHERFIRNMLAGSHGIDLVLFTVAADDGMMPQTEEHLDILHLLGIERAIFAITKCDLASPDQIRRVEQDIEVVTAGTALEGSPAVPCSFVTGQGLDDLRERIAGTLRGIEKAQPPGEFRLPVDRAFVLQGHGLVVTGTALSGTVAVGDRVRCLPGPQTFRVRSLQVHGQPVDVATWGQRIALNLGGAETAAVERGQVVCHESLTMTSTRFDARLDSPPTTGGSVESHQRVRIHAGTAERFGKIILLGAASPDAPATYCQVRLDEPLPVMRGDRFVIRDETARRTIGGGMVLHPWAGAHRRADPTLAGRLATLDSGDVPAVVLAFLHDREEFAVLVDDVRQFLNLRQDEMGDLVERIDGVRLFSIEDTRLCTTEEKWRRLRDEFLSLLAAFHEAHPLLSGMEMEELRDTLSCRVAPRLFRTVLEELEAAGTMARDANLVRLPGHTVRLRDEEQDLSARVTTLLGARPLAPPDLGELAKTTGADRSTLTGVIRLMERDGSIVRVTSDLYFLRDDVERMKADVYEQFSAKGEITPATFRGVFETSRKYTIPLLEYLDKVGITVRAGNTRRLSVRP